MNLLSSVDLENYCVALRQPSVRAELAARTGLSANAAGLYLDAICNEAQTGLRLLQWSGFRPPGRVLEVGAGGGLLSGFLQSRGVDLVAIEPTEQGFELTPKLAALVSAATGVSVEILPLSARGVRPEKHGLFNLIFSVNVIEHFQPMIENLDALTRLMARRGIQVHTCPNYHVPYEPHYGIALLPFSPRLTPHLGRRQLFSEGLWRSLNFITATDLLAYATRSGLAISFKQGALAEALDRLCTEPEFAARQPKFLSYAAKAIKVLRLMRIVKNLPPTWVTPLTVILRRSD
jgi:2-polyprenyl-3-methyl-5-hydroxy-6-metoxy-1,4-benzoquinol methylase